MANETKYKVLLTGDASDLIKKVEGATDAVKVLDKTAESIVLSLKLENQEAVAKFLTNITSNVPDLVLKAKYDFAVSDRNHLREEMEQFTKLENTFNFDTLGISGDEYKARVRDFIDGLVKNIDDYAKTDFDPVVLKQKVQELFDVNKYFGNMGYSLQTLRKNIKGMVPSDLVDVKNLKGRKQDEIYKLIQERNKSIKEYNDEAAKRGIDLTKDLDFNYYNGSVIKSTEEVGNAAKEAGDKAKEAVESFESFGNIKGFDGLILSIRQLVDALKQMLGITEEISSNGSLENILQGAIKQGIGTKTGLATYINKNLSKEISEEDRAWIKNAVVKTANISEKNGVSVVRSDYKEWASEVITAMDQAGKSIDQFAEKKQIIKGTSLFGGSAKPDADQINSIKTSIDGISESFNKIQESISSVGIAEKINEIQTSANALKDALDNLSAASDGNYFSALLTTLTELSEVIQKSTGILSSSNLAAEFERIQQAADALGNGNLAKGRKDLQAIVDQFNAYKAAGGSKELSDISQNATLVAKLQQVSDASEQAAQKQRELADAEVAAAKAAESAKTTNIESSLRNIENSTAPKTIEDMSVALEHLWLNSEAGLRIDAQSMLQVQPIIEGIMSIVDALNELVDAFKRVNGDAALNLNELFDSIQNQAKSISNAKNYTVTGTARAIADNIYSRYQYYQQRGGDRDLKVSKNLQNYWDSYTPEKKSDLGLSAETKEFDEIQKAAMDAAAAKELFVDANEEVRKAAQQTIGELEKERLKFQEVGTAASEAAKHKDAFAKGFSQAFGNVGDLKAYASALKSYAQILKGVGSSEVKRNKLSQSDFTTFGNLKSLINGDATLQQMYGQRLSDLDLQIGAFVPGVDSIDDVRKAMADLRADAETTASSMAKAAKSATNTIINDFNALKKTTKNVKKLMGVENLNKAQEKQWDNYFDQYENVMASVSGKTLSQLPQQATTSIEEISKVLENAEALSVKIEEIRDASSGFTGEYKKSIDAIAPGIEKITNRFNGDYGPDKIIGIPKDELKEYFNAIRSADVELEKASSNRLATVKEVQDVLNKAYRVGSSTNNKDVTNQVSEITSELEKARDATDGLRDSFTNISSEKLKEADSVLNKLAGDVDRTGSRVGTFAHNLASQMTSQMASLVAQYTSIRFMFRYAKQIAQTVTAVDSAITELRKVSGESNTRLAESFKTSAATAQELGATITDVINSTADWARLGYGIDQAEELARVTQLLQTVGDNMTQETASKSLVSILQGYKIDASQAERTVDSINEVANNFAIDTAGIGDALQRSAAALNAAGTDLNKSIALVTTANAVLQNPETVGTMFKTMSARIRGATTELSELGEEEDEFTQTTSKLRDLVKELTGFDIMKDENTYKDIYEIILGISKEWGNLTDIEQASLGEALGGKRGINALFAVLNNPEGLENAYKTALGAEGSAMREQEAYAQSVQYSIDRLKASAQELSVSFMNSDFLKGLVERGNSVLQFLTSITDKLGSLGSVIAAIGGIDLIKSLLTGGRRGLFGNVIMAFAQTLNGGSEIKSLGYAFKLIGAKAAEAGTDAGAVMAKNMAASIAAHPVAFGAAGVAIAAAIAVAAYSAWKKHQQDLLNEAKTAADKWSRSREDLEDQYEEVAQLRNKLDNEDLDDDERLSIKKQIYEIQKQITSEYGNQASGIDLINGKLEAQKNLLMGIEQQEAAKNLVNYANAYAAAENVAIGKADFSATMKNVDPTLRNAIIERINGLGLEGVDAAFNEAANELTILFTGARKDIVESSKIVTAELQKMKDETAAQISKAVVSGFGDNDRVEDIVGRVSSIRDTISKGTVDENKDAYFEIAKIQDEIVNLYGEGAKEVDLLNGNLDEEKEKLKEIASKGLYSAYTGSLQADAEAIQNTINKVVSAASKDTKAYDEIKDTYESYLEQQFFAKGHGQLAVDTAKIVDDINEGLASGDTSGVDELVAQYNSKIKEIEETATSIGWDDEKVKTFISKVTSGFNEAAVAALKFKEQLQVIQTTPVADLSDADKQMAGYLRTIERANLDVVDIRQMLEKESIDATGQLAVTEAAVQQFARAFGVAFDSDSIEQDAAKIETIINLLHELGLAFDGTGELIKNSSVMKGFSNEIKKYYSNLDTVNGSLVAASSGKGLSVFGEEDEEGNIVSDVGNIMKAYKDLDGYNPSELFRTTANGVKVNEKELRKLQKQQDKIVKKKFLKQQKELTDKLAKAQNNLARANRIGDDTSGYEKEIASIQKDLLELGRLQSAYEGATSAYQKWLDAQSAGERGDVYDNIQENALKRAKELYESNLTGTNEFRALMGLMTGQDVSESTAVQLSAMWENFGKTIEGTKYKVADFFKEGTEGTDAFADALVKLDFATREGNIINFDNLDTEEIAKRMGTSVDMVEAIFEKMNDFGAELTWRTKEQADALKEIDNRYAEVKKHVDESMVGDNKKLSQYLDLDSLNTVEELANAEQKIRAALKNPAIFNINDEQAKALAELLDLIIEKRNVIEMPFGQEALTVSGIDAAKENLDSLEEKIAKFKEYKELGFDINIENEKDIQELAEWMAQLDEDVQLKLGIEPTKEAQKIIDQLLNPEKKVTVTPQRSITTAAKDQARSERVERTTTNTTVNKEITDSETNLHVNVDSASIEAANQAMEELKNSTPEEIATKIVCETYGIKDVNELSDAEKEVVNKDIRVLAKVLGEDDAEKIARTIDQIHDKTAYLNIKTIGTNELQKAFNEWRQFNNGETKITYLKTIHETEYRAKTKSGAYDRINGTAHALGTLSGYAHAGGKWGLPNNQKALINEVGPEMVVRGSNWFIPNDGRPTMDFPLRKGDIIFNAKQTEELLKNGYVTRGYARADGTAYANINGKYTAGGVGGKKKKTTSSSSNNSKSSNSSSNSDSKKAAEEAAEEVKDWIEVLLDRITRAFENFKEMSDYWSSYVNKNRELNNAISQAQKNITYNQQAYARYMKQANSVGLSDKYAKQVQNGTIDIEKIKDEKLREKIDQYTEWYLIMPTQSIMIA